MPFFDAAPPDPPLSPAEIAKSAHTRWLGWLAIPVPLLFASMDSDPMLLTGLIAGWLSIAFSHPRTRGLKWIFFALYPLVMGPIAGIVGFLSSSKPMRLF
jgi:hypothetical protein